jgi:predicted transcriptional regulator
MKTITVRDLMVPFSEYAVVSKEATLHEAVTALEKAQKKFDKTRYWHRAILVFGENNQIVGKISQIDILRSLEPKHAEILELAMLSPEDLSPRYIKSVLEKYYLWKHSLDNICEKAAKLKIKDVMHTPAKGEYVKESAALGEAIHQLLTGCHRSLLVTKAEQIVGILRLTDMFKEICERIKACERE